MLCFTVFTTFWENRPCKFYSHEYAPSCRASLYSRLSGRPDCKTSIRMDTHPHAVLNCISTFLEILLLNCYPHGYVPSYCTLLYSRPSWETLLYDLFPHGCIPSYYTLLYSRLSCEDVESCKDIESRKDMESCKYTESCKDIESHKDRAM